MAMEIFLDCLGMKCPRPIIEIAKAARRNTDGAVLRIKADDLAFESDVRAWCETCRGELVSLERDGAVFEAVIRLNPMEGR